MSKPLALPEIYDPDEIARHMGWSPRRLRVFARGLGACRVLGKRMVLTSEDVQTILEASRPCHSNSTSGGKSGGTVARLPDADYMQVRKRLTERLRSASPTGQKRRHSNEN